MSLRPLRGALLAVVDGDRRVYDTVQRAWWRGPRLTRVVLRHLGARAVDRVELTTPGVLAPRGAVLYLAAEVRS